MKKFSIILMTALLVVSFMTSCDLAGSRNRSNLFDEVKANDEVVTTIVTVEALMSSEDLDTDALLDSVSGSVGISFDVKGVDGDFSSVITQEYLSAHAGIKTINFRDIATNIDLAEMENGPLALLGVEDFHELFDEFGVYIKNDSTDDIVEFDVDFDGNDVSILLDGSKFDTNQENAEKKFVDAIANSIGYDIVKAAQELGNGKRDFANALDRAEATFALNFDNISFSYDLPSALVREAQKYDQTILDHVEFNLDGDLMVSVSDIIVKEVEEAGSKYIPTHVEANITIKSNDGIAFYVAGSYGIKNFSVGAKINADTKLRFIYDADYGISILYNKKDATKILEDVLESFEDARSISAVNSGLNKIGFSIEPYMCVQDTVHLVDGDKMIDWLLNKYLFGVSK